MITKKLMEQKIKKRRLILLPVFPLIYFWYWLAGLFRHPIFKPGIHVITGDTGGGKTLLAHKLAKRFNRKGRPIVSNSKFSEKPGLIKKINILDHFGDFRVKKEITNCVLVLDEISQEFNRRLNKRTEYNASFIPLKQFMMTHRHDGVSHIYLLAQSFDDMDGQLINVAQHVHFVHSKFNPSLPAWLRQDKLRPMTRPKKIRFFTRRRRDIVRNDYEKYVKKGEIKYKPPIKGSIDISINDLLDFNTHAFKNSQLKDKPFNKSSQEKKGGSKTNGKGKSETRKKGTPTTKGTNKKTGQGTKKQG